jgi:hypothetical protein
MGSDQESAYRYAGSRVVLLLHARTRAYGKRSQLDMMSVLDAGTDISGGNNFLSHSKNGV